MTSYRPVGSAAALAVAGLLLAGCAGSGNELTTASLFGSNKAKPAAAAAPAAPATPQARALEVAAVSARATKCGYNFDPARLRSGYLASEATGGLPIDQMANLEKAYDAAHSGVLKAISGQGDYCTEQRTNQIKADLTRHLAGDYSIRQTKQVAVKKDDGIFGGLFSNDCPDCEKPTTADSFYDITGRPKNSL